VKQHLRRSVGWRIYVIFFVVAFAFACATVPKEKSMPPEQPIKDFRSIAGKWQGERTTTAIGSTTITMIIKEDGTWEITIPLGSSEMPLSDRGRFYGTGELSGGKYVTKETIRGDIGEYTLHEGEGKRVLFYWDRGGKSRAWLEPAKE
jgi:hypothetical protein